jgi:hypothetical protein
MPRKEAFTTDTLNIRYLLDPIPRTFPTVVSTTHSILALLTTGCRYRIGRRDPKYRGSPIYQLLSSTRSLYISASLAWSHLRNPNRGLV